MREYPSCGPNSGPTFGNPILTSSGSKLETRTDFATADGRLSVERYYRSLPQRQNSIAATQYAYHSEPLGQVNGWGFWFSMEWHLQVKNISTSGSTPGGVLYLPDGTAYDFAYASGAFVPSSYVPNTDYKLEFIGTLPAQWSTLFAAPSQWRVTDLKSGRIWLLKTVAEDFNASTLRYNIARPIKMTDADGYVQNFTYGTKGEIASVTDSYGRTLGFNWRNYNITSVPNLPGGLPMPEALEMISLPDGSKLVYTYDPPVALPSAERVQRLISVVRKNAASVTVKSFTYHYEDLDFPQLLTGITDARGVRYATFAYDRQGRAISSEHAGGVDRYTASYGYAGSDLTRTVTNPLGKASDLPIWQSELQRQAGRHTAKIRHRTGECQLRGFKLQRAPTLICLSQPKPTKKAASQPTPAMRWPSADHARAASARRWLSPPATPGIRPGRRPAQIVQPGLTHRLHPQCRRAADAGQGHGYDNANRALFDGGPDPRHRLHLQRHRPVADH